MNGFIENRPAESVESKTPIDTHFCPTRHPVIIYPRESFVSKTKQNYPKLPWIDHLNDSCIKEGRRKQQSLAQATHAEIEIEQLLIYGHGKRDGTDESPPSMST